MEFGKEIKKARERKGMTQKELGEAIGVTQQAITKYEKEETYPRLPTLVDLALALDLDMDRIIKK